MRIHLKSAFTRAVLPLAALALAAPAMAETVDIGEIEF
jgi:hypothetical protein